MDRRAAWPELLATAGLAFGALVGLGLLAVWFLRPTGLWFLGGVAAVLAAPFAIGLGLLGGAGLAVRRARGTMPSRRVLAACAAAVLLGIAGLGFAAGVVPQDILPRALTAHLRSEDAAAGRLLLSRGGDVVADLPFAVPAEGSQTVRSAALAPGPYDLEVRLADGRSAQQRVGVGGSSYEVLVSITAERIDVSQVHGD